MVSFFASSGKKKRRRRKLSRVTPEDFSTIVCCRQNIEGPPPSWSNLPPAASFMASPQPPSSRSLTSWARCPGHHDPTGPKAFLPQSPSCQWPCLILIWKDGGLGVLVAPSCEPAWSPLSLPGDSVQSFPLRYLQPTSPSGPRASRQTSFSLSPSFLSYISLFLAPLLKMESNYVTQAGLTGSSKPPASAFELLGLQTHTTISGPLCCVTSPSPLTSFLCLEMCVSLFRLQNSSGDLLPSHTLPFLLLYFLISPQNTLYLLPLFLQPLLFLAVPRSDL